MSKRMKDDIEISVGASALFGFAIYLIMQRVNKELWYLSIVAGVALALILVGYLLGYDRFVTKRYAKAIGATGYTPQLEIVGNFLTEFGKRTGRIYFCGDRIVLLGLDKKPHTQVEVLQSDVAFYEIPRAVQMNIHLKDGNCQTLHSVDAGLLGAAMKKKRWAKKK